MTPAASGTRRRCLCSTPPGRAGRSIIYTATMTIPGLLCRSYNRYLSAACRRYPVVGCNLPVQGRPHHRFVRRYGRRTKGALDLRQPASSDRRPGCARTASATRFPSFSPTLTRKTTTPGIRRSMCGRANEALPLPPVRTPCRTAAT